MHATCQSHAIGLHIGVNGKTATKGTTHPLLSGSCAEVCIYYPNTADTNGARALTAVHKSNWARLENFGR